MTSYLVVAVHGTRILYTEPFALRVDALQFAQAQAEQWQSETWHHRLGLGFLLRVWFEGVKVYEFHQPGTGKRAPFGSTEEGDPYPDPFGFTEEDDPYPDPVDSLEDDVDPEPDYEASPRMDPDD